METRRECQVTFSMTGHLIPVRQCLSLNLVASKLQSSPCLWSSQQRTYRCRWSWQVYM